MYCALFFVKMRNIATKLQVAWEHSPDMIAIKSCIVQEAHVINADKKGKNISLVHLKQMAGQDNGAEETKGRAL